MRLARLNGMMHPMFGLLAGLSGVVVLGLGGSLVVRGTITVGAFVAFGFYLGLLTWPLIALGWVINLFQRGAASMARLLDVLDAEPEIRSPANPAALPRRLQVVARSSSATSASTSPRPRGTSRAGCCATSRSACPRATRSRRRRDGKRQERAHRPHPAASPIRRRERSCWTASRSATLSLEALRAEIGYVPQESFLFSDTIASNLAYGDATRALVDHETIDERAREESRELGDRDAASHRWAAHVAQLDDTVRVFAHGYGTLLGERGINLSGGQKQRLALARALARRPRLVLLDDALSAVDTHTEAEILRGLRGALAGRTAVIASHRVSAVRDANQVIVLRRGARRRARDARDAHLGRRAVRRAAAAPAARGGARGGARRGGPRGGRRRGLTRGWGVGRGVTTTAHFVRQQIAGTRALYPLPLAPSRRWRKLLTMNRADASAPPSLTHPSSSEGRVMALEAQLKQALQHIADLEAQRCAQDAVPREHLARSAHAAHRGDHPRRDPARRHPRPTERAAARQHLRHHQRRPPAARPGGGDPHVCARRREPADDHAHALPLLPTCSRSSAR